MVNLSSPSIDETMFKRTDDINENSYSEIMIQEPSLSPFRNGDSQSGQQGQDTETIKKRFVCGICHASFGYKHVLQNHERIHTGEKPYECRECNKRFTRRHHLKAHSRLHTGEMPYECEFCQRKFIQVGNLRRHTRTHTGERPYSCQYVDSVTGQCTSTFSGSNQLKYHMLIHLNLKPHHCDVCHGDYRRKTHLKRHKCPGKPRDQVQGRIQNSNQLQLSQRSVITNEGMNPSPASTVAVEQDRLIQSEKLEKLKSSTPSVAKRVALRRRSTPNITATTSTLRTQTCDLNNNSEISVIGNDNKLISPKSRLEINKSDRSIKRKDKKNGRAIKKRRQSKSIRTNDNNKHNRSRHVNVNQLTINLPQPAPLQSSLTTFQLLYNEQIRNKQTNSKNLSSSSSINIKLVETKNGNTNSNGEIPVQKESPSNNNNKQLKYREENILDKIFEIATQQYVCGICGSSFEYEYVLENHQRSCPEGGESSLNSLSFNLNEGLDDTNNNGNDKLIDNSEKSV